MEQERAVVQTELDKVNHQLLSRQQIEVELANRIELARCINSVLRRKWLTTCRSEYLLMGWSRWRELSLAGGVAELSEEKNSLQRKQERLGLHLTELTSQHRCMSLKYTEMSAEVSKLRAQCEQLQQDSLPKTDMEEEAVNKDALAEMEQQVQDSQLQKWEAMEKLHQRQTAWEAARRQLCKQVEAAKQAQSDKAEELSVARREKAVAIETLRELVDSAPAGSQETVGPSAVGGGPGISPCECTCQCLQSSEWETLVDGSQRTYYLHTGSGVSQWTAPFHCPHSHSEGCTEICEELQQDPLPKIDVEVEDGNKDAVAEMEQQVKDSQREKWVAYW
jgi:hypothetical protein